jgi:eukaryotic-like serine/threonine-protein kinase
MRPMLESNEDRGGPRVSPLNLPRPVGLIRFGAFELDLRARELRKDGRSTGLPEQCIKVLHMLLNRPGELVLRDEIRSTLWPNDTIVEFDHSINTAIRKLRLALGDSADAPQYIETLARRGYRWIGPATTLSAEPQAVPGPARPAAGPAQLFDGQLTGKKVSHYRVLEVIGGGGMAVVYKAEDLKLGRRVALKFLPDELAHDPVALQRLEKEARAASALNHPNVCTIYEIAEHEGRPFIAMELLEGETLRERIGRHASTHRPQALEEQIELGVQICDALTAAHACGIVHRDIKPANIFVTQGGVAKVLDFGVAKLARVVATEESPDGGNAPPVDSPPNDLSLTRTGLTMGTAGYMSPEQVRGDVLDSRTDLFSFGLVLYEMATGRAAFGAATAVLMRDAILHSEPTPAHNLNPDVPDKLTSIIRKALEKERDQRYQSAAQIRADLQPLHRKMARKSARRKAVVATASLAVLITAMAIVWVLQRQPDAAMWPDTKLQQLTTNSWETPVTSGAISPDGRYLAYADAKGMHVKLVGTDDAQLVPPPEALRGENIVWELNSNAWFPDSRRFIATTHPSRENPLYAWSSLTSSMWTFSVAGGAPSKLRDQAIFWAISPDGASVAFGTRAAKQGESETWVMGTDGEQPHRVFKADDARAICCMHYFADGERVAYTITDDSGDTLVARDLTGGPVATLVPPTVMRGMGNSAWLPGGRLVYSDRWQGALGRFDTPSNYWIERFNLHSGKVTEGPRRVAKVAGAWLDWPSATADGRHVAFLQSSGHGTAYVADLDTGVQAARNARHFTLDEGEDAIADWTPDSQTAIITRNRGDYFALYKQALSTAAAQPIVARADGGLIETAVLSPDAKWVVLHIYPVRPAAAAGWPRTQIWRVPSDGGALQQLFSVSPGSGVSCARAPSTLCVIGEPTTDRREIVVSAFDPLTGRRGGELLRFDRYSDPDEGNAPPAFALSPDGQWLSMIAAPGEPLKILSLRGNPARVVPVKGLDVRHAAWMHDGSGLIVTSYGDDGAVLVHLDFQGNTQALWKCESGQTCYGTPSPDGRHLGIYQIRLTSNIWMLEVP